LPLFESGTTGTKGNTQPVIPFLTETYSNSADPPQEKSFPICTIKSFPNQISHTIHWAMDNFEVFNRAPLNVNKWIQDNNVFDKGDLNETSQGKEDVLNFLINMKIKTFNDCVHRAVDMFYNNFKTQIDKLLSTFPANHVNDDGSLYWSNGKRAPKSIELDLDNTYHYDYIEATSNLLARCYGLSKNDTDIKLIVLSYKFKEIVSENGVDIKLPSNDEIAIQNIAPALEMFYYWINLSPISRSSAVTGYMVLFASILAQDEELLKKIPKNKQLDWEAFFSESPNNFIKFWIIF
jgi:ubiquitin-activating enzyme E1